MKINQQYIADQLKVSRVTVTKALQDHTDIAIETRKKIKALAEELGYIPDGIGRSLSTKKTHTLGIVVPKINHSFFSTVIEEMFRSANAMGYKILLMVSFENEEVEFSSIKTLLSMNVDGIIVDAACNTSSDKAYELIVKNHTPLLFFDRKRISAPSPGVFFEDHRLSYELARKVVALGYKQFMYITGPEHINISRDRLAGFRQALQEEGLPIPNHQIIATTLDRPHGHRAFKEFLQTSEQLPECVFCANDSLALGVYDACEEAGIGIPTDLGVVGFGDLRVSRLVTPSLTTVAMEVEAACNQAIASLLQLIREPEMEMKDHLFSGQVMMRGSVRQIEHL